MRWIINYIRQCFCNHELEFENQDIRIHYTSFDEGYLQTFTSQTCKKCGYHKSYKKY